MCVCGGGVCVGGGGVTYVFREEVFRSLVSSAAFVNAELFVVPLVELTRLDL